MDLGEHPATILVRTRQIIATHEPQTAIALGSDECVDFPLECRPVHDVIVPGARGRGQQPIPPRGKARCPRATIASLRGLFAAGEECEPGEENSFADACDEVGIAGVVGCDLDTCTRTCVGCGDGVVQDAGDDRLRVPDLLIAVHPSCTDAARRGK